MDEGSLVQALAVYQASLDDKFDVDPSDDASDRGAKPIEELIKLQLEHKPDNVRSSVGTSPAMSTTA